MEFGSIKISDPVMGTKLQVILMALLFAVSEAAITSFPLETSTRITENGVALLTVTNTINYPVFISIPERQALGILRYFLDYMETLLPIYSSYSYDSPESHSLSGTVHSLTNETRFRQEDVMAYFQEGIAILDMLCKNKMMDERHLFKDNLELSTRVVEIIGDEYIDEDAFLMCVSVHLPHTLSMVFSPKTISSHTLTSDRTLENCIMGSKKLKRE